MKLEKPAAEKKAPKKIEIENSVGQVRLMLVIKDGLLFKFM